MLLHIIGIFKIKPDFRHFHCLIISKKRHLGQSHIYALASRPGMAWIALIGRELGLPVINLGFSGKGKLEKEMIKLIGEIDAQIFILDCFTNVTAPRFTDDEVREHIINAIKTLQMKRPRTPILLVEHDGYTNGKMRPARYENYHDIILVARATFNEIKKRRRKHLLSATQCARSGYGLPGRRYSPQ